MSGTFPPVSKPRIIGPGRLSWGEFDGLLNGHQHAALVRPACAGNVEGCAVIDGGADNRQANRDVYSGFNAEYLHGTVTLECQSRRARRERKAYRRVEGLEPSSRGPDRLG